MIVYFLTLWALNVLTINCFIIQDPYNFHVENSAHFKVDETVHENDFTMIDELNVLSLDLGVNKNKHHDFNKLYNTGKRKAPRRPRDAIRLIPKIKTKDFYETSTRQSLKTKHMVHKRGEVTQKNEKYDYDESLREYYEEMAYDEQQNDTYHPNAARQDILYYLKNIASFDKESNKTRLAAIQRLMSDYKENYTRQELDDKLWRVFRICVIVYLVVAVPLWCTKGWCCCCLCCKFFKPRVNILRAKKYLTENPPGMQRSRKDHTLYKPTDAERKAYLEFEHLIRII